jgi:hypothetical protein
MIIAQEEICYLHTAPKFREDASPRRSSGAGEAVHEVMENTRRAYAGYIRLHIKPRSAMSHSEWSNTLWAGHHRHLA